MCSALLDVDMYPCIHGCAFLQCRAVPKSRGLRAESAASKIQVFMIEHFSGDSEHLKSPGLPVARTLEAFAFFEDTVAGELHYGFPRHAVNGSFRPWNS